MKRPTVAEWRKAFKIVNSKPKKVIKVEWLDRCAIEVPNYCLCLNEKQYNSVLDVLGISLNKRSDFIGNGKGATNHSLTNIKTGKIVCVVCLADYKNRTLPEISGLLTHEAVHIWQEFSRYIGESNEDEFEAMTIQWISQSLFSSFLSQTKRK